MVAPVLVVRDESVELGFEISGQTIVLQQDSVLEGLVPTLDLDLNMGIVRCATDMLHRLIIEPFGQVAGDIAGSVVGQEPWLIMDDFRRSLMPWAPAPACW